MKRATDITSATDSSEAAVRAFLAQSLDRRWRSYRRAVRRCQRQFEEKAVHQLRVETRRLLALLGLLDPVLGGGCAREAARRIKKPFKSLARLRDTHVQLLCLKSKQEEFPELADFRKFLVRREKRLARRVNKKILAAAEAGWKKPVATVRAALRDWTRDGAPESQQAQALWRTVGAAYARVVELRRQVDGSEPETIHRMRVAFKRFRYMLETLQPLLPEVTGSRLKAMQAFQQTMGEVQDIEVLINTLDKYAKKTQTLNLERFREDLDYRHSGLINRFLETADHLFDFQPPRVCLEPEAAGRFFSPTSASGPVLRP